jgi:hypothetical protein
MLVLFYGHYNRFSLFFKWDFNALEYILFSYVCSYKKILMLTPFINIPKCIKIILLIWRLFIVNCHFKRAWKTSIEVMCGIFLFIVMGVWNFCWRLVAFVINTKKSCTHVLNAMICCWQGLTFISINQFSLYRIQWMFLKILVVIDNKRTEIITWNLVNITLVRLGFTSLNWFKTCLSFHVWRTPKSRGEPTWGFTKV